MNRHHLLSLVLFCIGIGFLVMGMSTGEVETGIVLIFPFIMGSGIYALIGVLLIFAALILFTVGYMTRGIGEPPYPMDKEHFEQKETKIKGGGIVLIGPIPIVFGSTWKIVVFLMALALVLILVLVWFRFVI